MEYLYSLEIPNSVMMHFSQKHLAEELMLPQLTSTCVSDLSRHSVHTDTTHIPLACMIFPWERPNRNYAKTKEVVLAQIREHTQHQTPPTQSELSLQLVLLEMVEWSMDLTRQQMHCGNLAMLTYAMVDISQTITDMLQQCSTHTL